MQVRGTDAPKHLEKATGKPAEVQKFKDELRQALGDRMVKSIEAWDAKMNRKPGRLRKRNAEDRGKSEGGVAKFMEAQGQDAGGIHFANHLPPSAEAQLRGQRCAACATDTPVFCVPPHDRKEVPGDLRRSFGPGGRRPPHVPKSAAGAQRGLVCKEISAMANNYRCR